MTPRAYWTDYAQRNGGPTGLSTKLGIPYSTLAGVCNGSRGIGRELAARIAAADPEVDETILVWVTKIADVSDSAPADPDPDADRIVPVETA